MRLIDSAKYSEDLNRAISDANFSSLRGSKILITGGTGLIGSTIIDVLLRYNKNYSANISIAVAARSQEKVFERFGNSNYIKWVQYDALQPISFQEDIDYIIHCAGNASPELYVSKAVETMTMNYIGLNELLRYANKRQVKKVLFLSSSEVYGVNSNNCAFSEMDYGYLNLLSPRSSYASAKRAAETLCAAYYKEYGVNALIARPGHVFGPTASISDRRVSSFFAFEAAKGNNLSLNSAGNQIRSYMYCIDCACAILMILINGLPGEAYNVCGRECISIKEMASCLAEAGGVQLAYHSPTENEISRQNPMDNSSLNGEKLKQLGFISCFTTKEALMHTVEILRELISEQKTNYR